VVEEVRRRLDRLLLEMKKNERRIGMSLAGKPSAACRLCGRQATPTGLCRDHEQSEENLKKAVEEWIRRHGGHLPREEVKKRLRDIPETGGWVKDLLFEKSQADGQR